MRHFEVAVIGSGPAGNAAVAELNKQKKNVLWIEEAATGKTEKSFSPSEIVQKYRQGGQSFILGRPIVPLGQPLAVGGGLTINAGLFQPPLEETYQSWNLPNELWSWTEFAKEMQELEKLFMARSENNGQNSISRMMIDGANTLNWNYKVIPQVSTERRIQFQEENFTGVSKEGGLFMSATKAISLKRAKGKWSIKCQNKDQEIQFTASKVYLACGPLQTPSLLIRSGLLPNLMSTFGYHPVVKVIAEYRDPLLGREPSFSPVQIKEFSPSVSIGSSISSRSLIWAEQIKNRIRDPLILKKFDRQLLFYCSTSQCPKTHFFQMGSAKDPFLFSFQRQMNLEMRQAIINLAKFIFATGADAIYIGGQYLKRTEQFEKLINFNRVSFSAIHLFASLPMGPSKNHFVDFQGRFRGDDSLYCIDASVLPASPAVNPQEAIMAISRRITRASV